MDREHMAAIVRSLRAIETDEAPSPEAQERAIAEASTYRREHGIPDIVVAPELPEEEFYRRARALGFVRHGSSGR